MTTIEPKLAAAALGALLALGGCRHADTGEVPVDAAARDARAPDAAPLDAHATDAAPFDAASADLPDAQACDHETCGRLLGMPPLPRIPCGGGYAYCDAVTSECSIIWYELGACMFTAGCGPRCEPLCDTSEDCLADEECIDGVCGGWVATPPIGCEPPFRQCWEGYICVPRSPHHTVGTCVEQ